MPPTKEELTERAQLGRLYEASCKIHFPTDDERNFRLALMKRLGLAYGLKEVKAATINPPGKA